MIYWQLFIAFIQVGLFSIGGGYAAIPVIKQQAIVVNEWITLAQFTDVITIAEMTPGPIAINSATFVGIMTAGIPGGIIATLGFVLPSLIICLSLAYFYFKYRDLGLVKVVLSSIRPAVVGLIGAAGVSIFLLAMVAHQDTPFQVMGINMNSVIIFLVCMILIQKKHFGPILIMVVSGLMGIILYL